MRSVRLTLPRNVRRAVLTAHIIASVGLLGDSAGFLAVAIRGASTSDPELAHASYELLAMFSAVFGIPLSVITLLTGVMLGVSSKWGVVRHGWVAAKLGLVVSVMAVGALVIGPASEAMRNGSDGQETVLIVAAAYDVLALSLATGLSVYKPGGRRRAARRRAVAARA
jgi:uncharacterized membrane protein